MNIINNNGSEKGHKHSGKSSRSFFNASTVLKAAGIKKGLFVLDVGCGEGHLSLAASKIVGLSGKIYAVDNHSESIEKLKAQIDRIKVGNIEAIVANVTGNIPLADGIIDFCLMANVLHGFVVNDEIKGSMAEIARVMKPGSTLAVIDFKKVISSPGPPLSIRLSPDEVEELITPYGFKVKRFIDVGPYHYSAIFSRSYNQR